jgi:hypothetical protein
MTNITSLFAPVVNWFKPKESEVKEAPRFEEWFLEMNPRTSVPNADEFAEVLYNFKFNKDKSNQSFNAN